MVVWKKATNNRHGYRYSYYSKLGASYRTPVLSMNWYDQPTTDQNTREQVDMLSPFFYV
ncbi:hypothetical protein L873DRAFT_1800953 [Choiromyces venosus 120613-1]|uniref:Uncharacterized protein n=1 Tax=Choiromyces venosus 120613-1 TaxID=1336337 RepID=A0A3N4K2B5_9PEZI|nr:hypothetical protein L873DRAFT_1800947 [Choiromyces venosus 120613-1]RPB03345.1 hypothetical protein L873DRAFT_1800953 [Choiromyces venosus 120613-1]